MLSRETINNDPKELILIKLKDKEIPIVKAYSELTIDQIQKLQKLENQKSSQEVNEQQNPIKRIEFLSIIDKTSIYKYQITIETSNNQETNLYLYFAANGGIIIASKNNLDNNIKSLINKHFLSNQMNSEIINENGKNYYVAPFSMYDYQITSTKYVIKTRCQKHYDKLVSLQ